MERQIIIKQQITLSRMKAERRTRINQALRYGILLSGLSCAIMMAWFIKTHF